MDRNEYNKYKREYMRGYSKTDKYKENHRKWQKEYLGKNPKIRLGRSIGALIYFSLRQRKAGRKWEDIVGYSIQDLTKHLEKQFDSNMSWENYGSYWWIDHIRPISLFDYEVSNDQEFKKCWALENLRPLEKITNIKKRDKC